MRPHLAMAALLLLAASPAAAAPQRIKELVDVVGVRENALIGYGLVVGLSGTGDTEQVLFTTQAVSGMLGRLGVRIDPREVRVRNVAAVTVTATLPAFARPGSRLDVTVASLGNARSLEGGVLLLTALRGPDGEPYAAAQGPIQTGGFTAGRAGSSTKKNQVTSGRVPAGATIEKSVAPKLDGTPLLLALRRPDFTTATRIAAAIDKALGPGTAKATDPATIEVTPPAATPDAMGTISALEGLMVEADVRAKVVVSERTGTVVAGERVRLRPAVVAHGGLTVKIKETPAISQPLPFSGGRTRGGAIADVNAREETRGAVALPATTTVAELVTALDKLGTTPRDLVAILQALHAAGALEGELEVQ